MREAVIQYGLFLAETLTLLLVIAGAVALITRLARRGRRRPWLEVKNVNRRYDDVTRAVRAQILPGPQVKLERKADRRRARAQAREQRRQAKHPQTTAAQPDGASAPPQRLRLFVLDFQGDVHASQVAALREEITAVLMIATPQDEVVLRLENPGGLVHDQGLAASQLQRLTDRGVPLTVAVDKVAASGGYLMACVATKILAAPFAIVGSIGVISQTPNFHRLLDRHGIDYEQFKGGEHKRTVTLFGRTSQEDRARRTEEVQDVHELFKQFVAAHRPGLDLAQVATGQYWYGSRALELGLVDELMTSDDYLLDRRERADIFEVRFAPARSVRQRLARQAASMADRTAVLADAVRRLAP